MDNKNPPEFAPSGLAGFVGWLLVLGEELFEPVGSLRRPDEQLSEGHLRKAKNPLIFADDQRQPCGDRST
jgi:hypothetical protein